MFKLFQENVWVNIDIPTKKFTIHTNCQYTDRKKETLYKGIENLKRDGGWLEVRGKERANLR